MTVKNNMLNNQNTRTVGRGLKQSSEINLVKQLHPAESHLVSLRRVLGALESMPLASGRSSILPITLGEQGSGQRKQTACISLTHTHTEGLMSRGTEPYRNEEGASETPAPPQCALSLTLNGHPRPPLLRRSKKQILAPLLLERQDDVGQGFSTSVP